MPGSICKSSGERGAFGLVVSHGCPYNRCAFCDLYKCDTYREVSLDQVEAELRKLFADGTAAKIAEQYGIEKSALILK